MQSSAEENANGRPSVVVDLVCRARQGDEEALSRLFDACRNYLHVVARSHVESWLQAKVDASDLVQQTLLEAHRDFQRFEGRSEEEWLAWLRKILKHNAADFVRHYQVAAKRRVGREAPIETVGARGAPEPADPLDTPSQRLARIEDERRVADAMAQLSADHREVIMLRNLQRLSFDEVARRMNRSRPAVQMLWMRAIKQMQQILVR